MSTFCPHCHEEVSPDELVDADAAWTCFNCSEPNLEDADECSTCGLSREASEYHEDRGE